MPPLAYFGGLLLLCFLLALTLRALRRARAARREEAARARVEKEERDRGLQTNIDGDRWQH